jgi:hypothetical protein
VKYLYRVLRWLFNKQINDELKAAILIERIQCAGVVKLHEQAGYLRGHAEGVQYAFDSIAARAGEDLDETKRVMLN